ncbi:MAG: DUF6370 family protein [Gemmatales bacterium]|nr:DUF6370 family protein [Gemmatales bacterium]MCS7160751.1 DUF6370 family protein [Gemmatales bacterium]MDW8175952.1 DUF6370 family protein [Gemmatales bacterium]
MRLIGVAMAAIAVVILAGIGLAQDKEVTLKGKITCARCELKKEKACATVIVVKKGDKDVIYYFDSESHKKYHGEICTEGKEGEVTGTLSKDNDRVVIKASKVSFK